MNDSAAGDQAHGEVLPSNKRPRNLSWKGAAGLLFGDWGTSRLYVLGLAFLVAGRSSFWLIAAMSLLIVAVAWAYTEVCRIYPDGGGVYSAARRRSALLSVVGALLLFADYTVTASLSAVEAFHYFGLGEHHAAAVESRDAGDDIRLESQHEQKANQPGAPPEVEKLWHLNSPGLWAIFAIVAIGALNLLGPKHSAGPAIAAAIGMVAITLLVAGFALPKLDWHHLSVGTLHHPPLQMWQAFVAVVLALSGVEAIANLTGVMEKPVIRTARKSIWIVAAEVAIFNLVLAVVMTSTAGLGRDAHKEDMLAFLAGQYVGGWGEWTVRIVGGLLLLSATNTAIGALMSTIYVMSRDDELPSVLQTLNGFGSPWIAAIIATIVPAAVLLFYHDLERLAQLYAIGIVGAVAMNCLLTAYHPRLRHWYRKGPMFGLGLILIAVWITLAITKVHALIFVAIVMAVGLIAREINRHFTMNRPEPPFLRRTIAQQLSPDALRKPKLLISTAGSSRLADQALQRAREKDATLVVCFIREVVLSYGVEAGHRLTLDTDPPALALFADWLQHGQRRGVAIIPMYDSGRNPAELIAEAAAIHGVIEVLIGTSRRGAVHWLLKGNFQRKLEALLPEDVPVTVLEEEEGMTNDQVSMTNQ